MGGLDQLFNGTVDKEQEEKIDGHNQRRLLYKTAVHDIIKHAASAKDLNLLLNKDLAFRNVTTSSAPKRTVSMENKSTEC